MEPVSLQAERQKRQPLTLEQLQQRILLRPDEAGALLGLPRSTVYRLCGTEFSSFVVRICGTIRIDRQGLENYLAAKRGQGTEV